MLVAEVILGVLLSLENGKLYRRPRVDYEGTETPVVKRLDEVTGAPGISVAKHPQRYSQAILHRVTFANLRQIQIELVGRAKDCGGFGSRHPVNINV